MTIKDAFQGIAPMTARVAVYVPGTSGPADDDAALAQRMTAETAAALSGLFGGATISPASGAWVSDSFGLIREAVNIVYSFTSPEALDRCGAEILAIVQRVKQEIRQECVSCEINGALYLV